MVVIPARIYFYAKVETTAFHIILLIKVTGKNLVVVNTGQLALGLKAFLSISCFLKVLSEKKTKRRKMKNKAA